jgi:hypothetical protein
VNAWPGEVAASGRKEPGCGARRPLPEILTLVLVFLPGLRGERLVFIR